MKKSALLPLLAVLALTGCARAPSGPTSRDQFMGNPLFAQRYFEDLTDRMVNLLQDPQTKKDAGLFATADAARQSALSDLQNTRQIIAKGKTGPFLNGKEPATGLALLLGNTLYFSSDFLGYPGPSVHVFLTTVLDPRDTAFPDKTSVDIGVLQSPYGAQQYAIPDGALNPKIRTVVLYDTQLKMIYGFVQL